MKKILCPLCTSGILKHTGFSECPSCADTGLVELDRADRAERIREARIAQKIGLIEMADRLSLTVWQVSMMEHGCLPIDSRVERELGIACD